VRNEEVAMNRLLLAGLGCWIAVPLAAAQECKVVSGSPAEGYRITVGGAELMAVPEAALTRSSMCDAERENATTKLVEREKELQEKKALIQAQQAELEAARAALAAYEALSRKQDLLIKRLEKRSAPVVTAEVGGGITGKDTEPAVMAGIGIKALRVWGFAQKDNAGALLGLSLTLY
jgi:hypothetical protein